MSNADLIQQCFYHINTFKRHRALTQIKRLENQHNEANFHELKAYQSLDNLELGLRALKKAIYDMEKGSRDEGNTDESRTS